jgi:hypothetical protein
VWYPSERKRALNEKTMGGTKKKWNFEKGSELIKPADNT